SGSAENTSTWENACGMSGASSGAQRGELLTVEPVGGPLVLRHGAQRLVEGDRRSIPVEHPPLEATQALLGADAGERTQQLLAEARPAVLRDDEEILEPDAVASGPGGEAEVPHRHAHDPAIDLGDVAEGRGV